ncbi:hypothetical protein LCGC14_1676310 [marine sediment metagenome]|uniref:Uncharacterized protein n=1 Tax=marine sediment metagenome TaxID=412755 RepID=A0A0F9K5J8_9ZZZZ
MRAGWNTTLEKRLRRADSAARIMIDVVVEVADDVRKRRDQWVTADSIVGLDFLIDGRVRLDPTLTEAIGHSPGTGGTITDLNRISPFQVARIVWAGNASRDYELHRIKAWLDPDTGGGKNVDKWVCQVFSLYQVSGFISTLSHHVTDRGHGRR